MENFKKSEIAQDEKPRLSQNRILRKLIPIIFSIIAGISNCIKADGRLVEEEFLLKIDNMKNQNNLDEIKGYYVYERDYSDKEISAMESAMADILRAQGKSDDFINGFIQDVRDHRMMNLLLSPPAE